MWLSKIKLSDSVKKRLPMIMFIVIIPLGILVGYFFSNIKNLFAGGYKDILTPINSILYVARVDGVGVSKGEWEKMLKSRYGQSAARDLIDIYMVNGELKKAGITVSENEINEEITAVETQLAGQSLETVLKQQGMTLVDFRKNVSMQVGMKKLLASRVVVTDEEVAEYVKSYTDSLTGTTNEEKAAEAKKALTEQKLGEEINKWYSDLQTKVVVENYLE